MLRSAALLTTLSLLAALAPLQPPPGWTYMASEDIQVGDAIDASGDVNGDGFNDLVVGARRANENQGRVMVFLGGVDGLPSQPSWMFDNTTPNECFGAAVCNAGDLNGDGLADIVVGAPSNAPPPFLGAPPPPATPGAVYVFYGLKKGSPWAPTGPTPVYGQANGSNFGISVSAGDANGDGYDDLLVGAPNQGANGALYLWYGKAAGIPTWISDWSFLGKDSVYGIGSCVAFVGNVNGDVSPSGKAYEDFVVGAPYGFISLGSALGFHGGASPSAQPVWATEGDGEIFASFYGCSVVGLDVNKDGYGDVVVGAPDVAGPLGNKYGRIYVYLGSATGLSLSPSQKLDGRQPYDQYGWHMAALKDSNGDGNDDLIMGTLDAANNAGAIFILRSKPSSSGFDPVPTVYVGDFSAAGSGQMFGSAVAGGDVNGDGMGDYIVGEMWMADTNTRPGGVLAYYSFNPATMIPASVSQCKLDGVTPLAPGATTHEPGFAATAMLKVPAGVGPASLQVDVQPVGTAFVDPPAAPITGPALTTSGPAQAAVTGLVVGTKYHWRARLVSSVFTSDWISFGSGPETTIDVQIAANPAPAAPSLALVQGDIKVPPGGTVFESKPLEAKSTAVDPDGDAVQLQVEFHAPGLASITASSAFVPSGATATITIPVLPPGERFVRSRIVDAFGVASAWVDGFDGAGAKATIKVSAYGSMSDAPCAARGTASGWIALLLLAPLVFRIRRS